VIVVAVVVVVFERAERCANCLLDRPLVLRLGGIDHGSGRILEPAAHVHIDREFVVVAPTVTGVAKSIGARSCHFHPEAAARANER